RPPEEARALPPPPAALFRLDRVEPSDPGGIRRALAALGAHGKGPPRPTAAPTAPGLPPCGPPRPPAAPPAAPPPRPPALRDAPMVGGFLAKRRERLRDPQDPLGFGDPKEEGPGGARARLRGCPPTSGTTCRPRTLKMGCPPEAAGPPPALARSFRGRSQHQDEPPRQWRRLGGLVGRLQPAQLPRRGAGRAPKTQGGAQPAPPHPEGPPGRLGPPDDNKPCPPPDPIGTERSQRAEKARPPPEVPGFTGGPPPTAPQKTGVLEAWGGVKSEKEALPLPPPSAGAGGLAAVAPRDWELLPGGGGAPAPPEGPPGRPPENKGAGGGAEPGHGNGGQVLPPPPGEPPQPHGSSFRPGTPLTPYRPLLVAGAALPPLPLKGPFLEFPPVGGPELAKLGGAQGGLLYPPGPPFLYSPFCPEGPLLQVRQELTPPSEFYGQGQSSFQQMLLPVVDPAVPPVVNFAPPPAAPPPPLPLLPLGRLLGPPARPFAPPQTRPEARGGRPRPPDPPNPPPPPPPPPSAPPGAPPPPRGPRPWGPPRDPSQ
ncbi:protein PRRC2A-like, partial [Phaenicophaeus curvirostris]|uniref:protein PRRC2A-like n=1 Tax=Phaenicophaeus curvirostris TaxID=33595 RepID=UPI0037F0EB98